MCDNVTAIAYIKNMGGIDYRIFALKVNCGSQQHTYQVKII